MLPGVGLVRGSQPSHSAACGLPPWSKDQWFDYDPQAANDGSPEIDSQGMYRSQMYRSRETVSLTLATEGGGWSWMGGWKVTTFQSITLAYSNNNACHGHSLFVSLLAYPRTTLLSSGVTVHMCVRIQAINLPTRVCSQMPMPAPEAHLEQGGRGGKSDVGESQKTHFISHSDATISESHHHHNAACDRPTKVRNEGMEEWGNGTRGFLLSIRNSSAGKAAHT